MKAPPHATQTFHCITYQTSDLVTTQILNWKRVQSMKVVLKILSKKNCVGFFFTFWTTVCKSLFLEGCQNQDVVSLAQVIPLQIVNIPWNWILGIKLILPFTNKRIRLQFLFYRITKKMELHFLLCRKLGQLICLFLTNAFYLLTSVKL